MHQPLQLLEQSELIHSAADVQAAILRLSYDITQTLQHESPVVMCVMGGGLVFAGQLMTMLNFRWSWITYMRAVIRTPPWAIPCIGSLCPSWI